MQLIKKSLSGNDSAFFFWKSWAQQFSTLEKAFTHYVFILGKIIQKNLPAMWTNIGRVTNVAT